MNCADFQDWLQRRLDGVDASEGDAEQHRAACASCAALHESLSRLEVGFRMRPQIVPPPGLSDAIVNQVLARRRKARLLQFGMVAALAAALLLAAYLGSRQTPVKPTAPPEVVKGPELLPAPVAVEPKLNDRVGEAGSALASLLSRTADETMKEGKLLLPEGVTPPTTDVTALTTPATQPVYDAGHSVYSGLEPVATEARRAVTLFMRDMPPMGTSMQ
jgi:hypothetical protein